MKISLRLANGWSPRVMNKGLHGKYNCDACGAKLWIGPGNIKYCDAVHSLSDIKKFEIVADGKPDYGRVWFDVDNSPKDSLGRFIEAEKKWRVYSKDRSAVIATFDNVEDANIFIRNEKN